MPRQNLLHLMTKIAFHFENKSANLLVLVRGFVSGKLLYERIHAATCLAGANRSDDGNSSEEATLRDAEPTRCFRRHRFAWIVNLADNEKNVLPLARIGVVRQAPRGDLPMCLQREDVEAREKDRINDIRRREKEEGVRPFHAQEHNWSAQGHELQENILVRERDIEVERHSRDCRQHEGDEILRIDEPLDHGFLTSAGGIGLRNLLCSFCSRSNSLSLEKTNRSADATM